MLKQGLQVLFHIIIAKFPIPENCSAYVPMILKEFCSSKINGFVMKNLLFNVFVVTCGEVLMTKTLLHINPGFTYMVTTSHNFTHKHMIHMYLINMVRYRWNTADLALNNNQSIYFSKMLTENIRNLSKII